MGSSVFSPKNAGRNQDLQDPLARTTLTQQPCLGFSWGQCFPA